MHAIWLAVRNSSCRRTRRHLPCNTLHSVLSGTLPWSMAGPSTVQHATEEQEIALLYMHGNSTMGTLQRRPGELHQGVKTSYTEYWGVQ